jgi:hypothetical protein
MPTDRPPSTRPTYRPGRSRQKRKIRAAEALIRSPGMRTRLRPNQSDTWPSRNRLEVDPRAYEAKIRVMVKVENRSRCW